MRPPIPYSFFSPVGLLLYCRQYCAEKNSCMRKRPSQKPLPMTRTSTMSCSSIWVPSSLMGGCQLARCCNWRMVSCCCSGAGRPIAAAVSSARLPRPTLSGSSISSETETAEGDSSLSAVVGSVFTGSSRWASPIPLPALADCSCAPSSPMGRCSCPVPGC